MLTNVGGGGAPAAGAAAPAAAAGGAAAEEAPKVEEKEESDDDMVGCFLGSAAWLCSGMLTFLVVRDSVYSTNRVMEDKRVYRRLRLCISYTMHGVAALLELSLTYLTHD
jgi:hypothetical protein